MRPGTAWLPLTVEDSVTVQGNFLSIQVLDMTAYTLILLHYFPDLSEDEQTQYLLLLLRYVDNLKTQVVDKKRHVVFDAQCQ